MSPRFPAAFADTCDAVAVTLGLLFRFILPHRNKVINNLVDEL
jgi:hypothetical protein